MYEANQILGILKFMFNMIMLGLNCVNLLVTNLIPYVLRSKKSVRNEIVLITGGGSGFGRELSLKFSRLGARIVIWDVDVIGNEETRRLVEAEGGQIDCYTLDVSVRELVYVTAQQVLERVGPVTILINNAGITYSKYFLETSDSLLEKVMAVNTMAHFWTMKAFLPKMIENNHGHVVCVSSVGGFFGVPQSVAYSCSKHAVMGLIESISLELLDLGKTGVKTTVVCPSFSKTSFFECTYDGILPMLEVEYVAEKITRAILTDKRVLYIPWYAFLVIVIKLISTLEEVNRLIRLLIGEALPKTTKTKTVFKEQECN